MLDSPWLFTVIYLGAVFGFFALLAGGLALWLRRRQRVFTEELELKLGQEPAPDIQLRNLENQIEKLITTTNELNERLKWIEGQLAALMAHNSKSSQKNTLEEQVYRAFDRGEPVAELARQFGRNKGEIELMINLRRMRREGGGST